MTREEAEKLCKVFEAVDGYCEYCAASACEQASGMGFGFRWFVENVPSNGSWNVSFEEIPT